MISKYLPIIGYIFMAKVKIMIINLKSIIQVVAGVKYTVDFDAKEKSSNLLNSCKAVILLQPWISEDPTVIDFNCTPKTNN